MPAPPNWNETFWNESTWTESTTPVFQPLPTQKKRTPYKIMAANPTPDDDDVVCALAEDLADGCHDHEVEAGIKQNTEVVLRAARAAAQAAKLAQANAQVLRDQRQETMLAADVAGAVVLKNCRLRNVKLFGGSFNPSWDAAGWPNQSTSIPDSMDKRFTLLLAQKNYFTAFPAAESADMEATAALCNAAHTTLSNARQTLNNAEQDLKDQKAASKAAIGTLRKRVRGLIDELGTLLPDDSTLYTGFGLNIPAHPVAPEAIATLTLTALGSSRVLAKWPYATRMTDTRLMVKRVGVDEDFISAGHTDGLDKLLINQTAGQTLEAKAIAYNDGGDAPPSPVASVTVT